ncbi:MAG: tRNA uridine-5-carboxymethylaminomethyl(34) synthesis GTPase MnmE [Oscillospiraceae bacterium]|nr:tRNA uridine-5-carboxymethylaminomethyl(34) synthesis GTPase MnmE [Oscillospiraceae bacterium]
MFDTIAALSTPPVSGAIGVIRLSGPTAVAVAGRVFVRRSEEALAAAPPRRLCMGRVRDETGATLDQALAVVFPGPDSYTGEDVVELHCHGSLPALRETLKALYRNGARPAEPGEFTKRAFLNGRMDLTQAEAVIDLITAETGDAARNAAGQLDGTLGRSLTRVWDKLTFLCAHFQAMVDYPEEDVPPLTNGQIAAELTELGGELARLGDTYNRGRRLREGIPCALLGKPNVGKSSLLNALLGYDRAIVTETPGATRDTLEESVHMGGVWLRVSDTAGLRETDDEAERQGVQRARQAARRAGLVLLVLDGSCELDDADRAVMDEARGGPAVVLVNKSDLPCRMDMETLESAFLYVLPVSARTGTGLEALDSVLRRIFAAGSPPCDGGILTNLRQAEAVARAAAALTETAAALTRGVTPDAALTGLEDALGALEECTGRQANQDILTQIFARFCIGK